MDWMMDLMRSKRSGWEEHCAADTCVSASDSTLQPGLFDLTRRARRFWPGDASRFVANRKVCVLTLLSLGQNRSRQIHHPVHNSL